MAEQLRVFVSHSHQDNAFCHAIVAALREAGADVWYDQHNMGSDRLGPTIERELRDRPVFVVILSPAALRSQWVEDETRWAYSLQRKDPARVIQPVTGATIREDDVWLFLQDFKRIEASGYQPYPEDEAASRLLSALGLAPLSVAPVRGILEPDQGVDDWLTRPPEPTEDAADLMERSKELRFRGQYAEALPLDVRATQLDPSNAFAWSCLGYTLYMLERHEAALTAYDHSLALNPDDKSVWFNKASSLRALGRTTEADAAVERGKWVRG